MSTARTREPWRRDYAAARRKRGLPKEAGTLLEPMDAVRSLGTTWALLLEMIEAGKLDRVECPIRSGAWLVTRESVEREKARRDGVRREHQARHNERRVQRGDYRKGAA